MTVDLAALPCRFGPYVLVRALGGGGMGDVFLALQGRAGVEKLCVVKRLIPETANDAERVARFRREGEIVRRLSHGAIAQTIAVDEIEGEPFIVQEFLEGRTLTQVISAANSAGRRLPTPVALHIVREICRALAYAHRLGGSGVIHRDVAPDNIMLTFSGEVRLIDFGIARAPLDRSLTQPGMVVGRESYSAPELLRGEPGDNRSDIYSLGIVLWELLAGRPLWLNEIGAVPAPSAIDSARSISAELDRIVLQALATRPADRFQTSDDLQRALGPSLPVGFVGDPAVAEFMGTCYDVETERRHLAEAVREGRDLMAAAPAPADVAHAPPPQRRRWSPFIVGASVALLGVVLVALLWRRPSPQVFWPERPGHAVRSSENSAPARLLQPSESDRGLVEAHASGAPALVSTRRSNPSVPTRRPSSAGASAGLLLDRARDNLQIGDLAAAEHEAREVLKSGSPMQRARAYTIIGQILVLNGRPADAEDEFRAAIELDPSNNVAAAALARLRVGESRGGPL